MQTSQFSQQCCWRYMLMGCEVVTGWALRNVSKGLRSFNMLGTSCPTTHHHIPDHVHLKHTQTHSYYQPMSTPSMWRIISMQNGHLKPTWMPTPTASLTYMSVVKMVIIMLWLYQLIPRSCAIAINAITLDMVIYAHCGEVSSWEANTCFHKGSFWQNLVWQHGIPRSLSGKMAYQQGSFQICLQTISKKQWTIQHMVVLEMQQ